MPSLPTSLIIVCLVVAWLVVLVPMVAKRREEVPENLDDSETVRVLERGSRVGRRRAVLSRTAMAHRTRGPESMADRSDDDADGDARRDALDRDGAEGDFEDDLEGDGSGVRVVAGTESSTGIEFDAEVDDAADVDGAEDDAAVDGRAVGGSAVDDRVAFDAPADSDDAPATVMSRGEALGHGRGVAATFEDDAREELGGESVRSAEPVGAGASRGRTSRARSGRNYQRVAPAAEWSWERESRREVDVDDEARSDARGDLRGESRDRFSDGLSGEPGDAAYRGAPVRTGRGGFNPAAADRARAYRFRQRRRVALALLLIAVAGAAAGWLGVGFGYPAAVAGGVLLVLYFAYLRRQVRIEAEIRQRRFARMDRARQIRPAYRPSVAEQVYAHRTGELPRPGVADGYQVKSHARASVPPVGYGHGVPVDLDDSDPVFDDLEYYRPAVYRRRAG